MMTLRVPTSRSRRANGVSPRATPSTVTFAPLGTDRTSKRPGFVLGASGAWGAWSALGAGASGAFGAAPAAFWEALAAPEAPWPWIGALAMVCGGPDWSALGRAI